MESEAEIIIAFVFKRSGKNKLKESEIYLPLSIELGWFSTKDSHEFVNYAVQQKLLTKKDGLFVPSFDIEKISIPIGFYPSKQSYVEDKGDVQEKKKLKEEKTIIDAVVHQIVEKTNQDPKGIAEEIKQVSLEKNILPEVAALLVAKDYDIDIEDSLERVEKQILRENVE